MHRFTPVVVALLLGSSLGCGSGRHELRPDDRVTLGPQEGVLALAVESNAEVANITFCREDDLLRCVSVGPFAPGESLRLARVDAGAQCVFGFTLHLNTGVSVSREYEAGQGPCLVVEAGTVSYSGHLVIHSAPTQTATERVAVRVDPREGVPHEIEAQYPFLAGYPVRSTMIAGAR